MLAKIHSAAVIGLQAESVDVEVDVGRGMATLTLVGLPDAAVRESGERMKAAIRNSGYRFPDQRITINLAPADLRKEGPAYDLPIAIGVLVASGQLPPDALDGALVMGELSLDGVVRHVRGVLSVADMARHYGIRCLYVPAMDAQEAALIPEVTVYPVASLRALAEHLQGAEQIAPLDPGVGMVAKVRLLRPTSPRSRGKNTPSAHLEVAAWDCTTCCWWGRLVRERRSWRGRCRASCRG